MRSPIPSRKGGRAKPSAGSIQERLLLTGGGVEVRLRIRGEDVTLTAPTRRLAEALQRIERQKTAALDAADPSPRT